MTPMKKNLLTVATLATVANRLPNTLLLVTLALVASIAGTSYSPGILESQTTYFWRVAARNAAVAAASTGGAVVAGCAAARPLHAPSSTAEDTMASRPVASGSHRAGHPMASISAASSRTFDEGC